MADSTQRFADRVDDYVRYRPGYPRDVLTTLERELGIGRDVPVADLGSGTGISTRIFLESGYEVFAVEPNEAMRAAGERAGRDYPRFHSVAGTAEATTLPDGSVGLAIAAQAFHWFDAARVRVELARILRPPALVALLWNARRVRGPFLEAYERTLLAYSPDYARVRHQDVASEERIAAFYGTPPRTFTFRNDQQLDRASFVGRVMSSSYAPKESVPFRAALEALWDEHGSSGEVIFEYDTQLSVGTLT